jgi:hypothetical protein
VLNENNKYILAAGCSFTAANWFSWGYPDYDCSFPKWPALLGDKLGVNNVVNLGKSGAGNDLIINRVIDYILNNEEKPWLVVIGLSEAIRFTPYDWQPVNPFVLARETVEKLIKFEFDDWIRSFTSSGEWLVSRDQNNDFGIMRAIFSNYIRQVNRIVKFCHRLNIRVIVGALMWPVNINDIKRYRIVHNLPEKHNWTWDAIPRLWMDCEGFNDVDPKAVIGWPIWPELGGKMLTGLESEFNYETMKVGPKDGHPNALGHQHIAEKFYEHYKKIY